MNEEYEFYNKYCDKPKYARVSFRLEQELFDKLRQEADNQNITLARLMRDIIFLLFQEDKKVKT